MPILTFGRRAQHRSGAPVEGWSSGPKYENPVHVAAFFAGSDWNAAIASSNRAGVRPCGLYFRLCQGLVLSY